MKINPKFFLYSAWITSLTATVGSLFFSEVMHFPPCVLCWHQRIAMYPLVIIFAVGILRKDLKVYLYALPLAIVGFLVGVYHNLLYYKIIPESIAPCINGVSCTTKFIQWFGFLTIPSLSLIAFSIIILSMVFYMRSQKS